MKQITTVLILTMMLMAYTIPILIATRKNNSKFLWLLVLSGIVNVSGIVLLNVFI